MSRHITITALLTAFTCIGTGCEAPPPPPVSEPYRPPDPWSHEQEQLYQTREVISYLDEQRELELRRLDDLGVLPPDTAEGRGEPQAEQQETDGAGIAPAHEGG
jgi:hypothetical protein